MSEEKFDAKKDQLSGKAKEVAGKAIGDHELEAEGKTENLAGKMKDAANGAKENYQEMKDTVEGAVNKIKDSLKKK